MGFWLGHHDGPVRGGRVAGGKSIKDIHTELPSAPANIIVGGLVQGTVEIELFEGESIIDRNGKIVGTVINGEFVQKGDP